MNLLGAPFSLRHCNKTRWENVERMFHQSRSVIKTGIWTCNLPKSNSHTVWAQLCVHESGINVDQSESLHQHEAAVHTAGSKVRGLYMILVPLPPTDLLPYNNSHNPPPDQNTEIFCGSGPQISWAQVCGWCDIAGGGSDLIRSGPRHICPELR